MILRLILLVGLMAGGAPPGPSETILWLGSRAPAALDEVALLQAVAVYTRDLRIAVRSDAEMAAELPFVRAPAGASRVAARLRGAGARLAFWCEAGASGGDVVLYTVDVQGAIEAHAISSPGLAGPELYRAVALKLRSVLAGTEPPPPPEVAGSAGAPGAAPPAGVPGQPAGPGSAPPPIPEPAATGARPASTIARSAAVAAAERTAPPSETEGRASERSRFSGSIGYRLALPTGQAPLRQALAIEGSLALGRRFELTMGSELAPAADGEVATGRVSLFDLPIRIGARWVRPGRRLWFAAGAFGALHLLSAQATDPAGGSASTFTAAAGLGAEGLLRIPLTAALAGELRLFAETSAPHTAFWVGGTRAIELGTTLGGALGLAFPGP